jgi:hypothetical protein
MAQRPRQPHRGSKRSPVTGTSRRDLCEPGGEIPPGLPTVKIKTIVNAAPKTTGKIPGLESAPG